MGSAGSPRRLRLPLAALAAGTRTLASEEAHYVARVHRLVPGDRLVVFDPQARCEADATVTATGRHVVVAIDPLRPATLVATRPVTVVQAISKGSKVDQVVRDATELGATRVVPALAERSQRHPGAAAVARWRRVALEAARQCGRGDVPEVDEPVPLGEAIVACALATGAFTLEPRAELPLARAAAALAADSPIALAIGPEGGFTQEELAAARRAGWAAVSLGPFVLRTETACAAALGAVAAISSLAVPRSGA